MEKLLLIDGNSLINRAYYAFGSGGGLTFNGAPTNATYGFLNMFVKAVTDTAAKYVAVAFDMRAKTFRHKMFDGYKATRKGMPDELAAQFADLKYLLDAMGVAVVEKEGYEADDIIGTLCKGCGVNFNVAQNGGKGAGVKSFILSADRDGLQLVDACTELHLTKTGVSQLDIWDEARIMLEYGLTPAQFIDLKALMGDKSDNIPGALGVGEKTALGLMQEYGSLEEIYSNINEIRGTLRDKLIASEKMVYLSRDLARINTEVPIEYDLSKFEFSFPFDKKVYDAFWERGFKSLCKRSSMWAADYYSEVNSATDSGFIVPGAKPQDGTQAGAGSSPVSPSVKVVIIREYDELENLATKLMSAKFIVNTCDPDAVYLATDAETEYRIIMRADLLSGGFEHEEINKCLKPLYESDIPKAIWDSKALKERLAKSGIQLNNVTVDIKLCDHLLNSNTTFTTPQDLLARYKISGNAAAAPFFGIDFLSKLASKNMLELYQQIELPLVDVLIGMQTAGVKIDLAALQSASEQVQKQIADTSARIFELSGQTFNMNSPQQLGEVLFKKLGIETTQKTKTGLSTNEAVLHKIASKHPVVPEILRYRKLYKLHSTYLQSYKNLVGESGFVHSSFHNTTTVTGRLSSSEPNIQNIPARSEDAKIIRGLFISRFDGGKIVSADYSQIELRLLAHLSGDASMCDAFSTDRDIHTETACKIFAAKSNLVTPEMRRAAKAVNFGIVYGISSYGLAEGIGCSVIDAAHFIEKYFSQFPSVKRFLDKCRDDAIGCGYAVTMLNRRRHIPELASSNQNLVQFGTRAAMNMPMQGSASDIIKKAMVEVNGALSGKNIKAVMIAQIHDELLFDCPSDEIETLTKTVKQIMEGVVNLKVPLTVGIEVSDTF